MLGDQYTDRAKLRGYIFEIVISKLLHENGFSEITQESQNRIRIPRAGFVEFKGRGGWHQIDCPFDYNNNLPFINPIRLLAEIKFYRTKVQKNIIRETIGTLKDIQENYFADQLLDIRKNGYTELGVLFSASGFSDESEMLAFSHNIKTVSYNNVPLMKEITDQITFMEERYFRCRNCIGKNKQSEFTMQFKRLLYSYQEGDVAAFQNFVRQFDIPDGLNYALQDLGESIREIRCNFIANTSGGALLHFISDSYFPDELFNDTDQQNVRVYYDILNNGERIFWMKFSEDPNGGRFYFNPPESLAEAAFWGGDAILDEKERYFRTLHISRNINNVSRNLSLILDTDWLDRERQNIYNR